jgi:hypothetical protein
MTREPLRTLLLPVAALAFAAAAQAFINGADIRGVVTAILGVLIAAATELARGRVTPAPAAARVDGRSESGQGIVEVLLIMFLILVILVVLLKVL